MQSAPKHVIVHHNIWHILVTSKTWFLFVLISSWWLFLSLKNVFFIRTFISQFIEKGFMKTENSECSVLLLLFLFTLEKCFSKYFLSVVHKWNVNIENKWHILDCFDLVTFAIGCDVSRTVSPLITCDLVTCVWACCILNTKSNFPFLLSF